MKMTTFLLGFALSLLAGSAFAAEPQHGWTLQDMYWLVGMGVGLIATTINVVLFWRGRPDKVKQAVEAAVKPVKDRLDELESEQRNLDAKIESRVEERLDDHREMLTRIETEVKSGPNRGDLNELHRRVTEVAKALSGVCATQKSQGATLERISSFLMEGGGRGSR